MLKEMMLNELKRRPGTNANENGRTKELQQSYALKLGEGITILDSARHRAELLIRKLEGY